MIKPLRDIIVAVPIESTGRVGALWMPDNTLQGLRTHRKMLVIAAGPQAVKQGCEAGAVIHASETWGEVLEYREKKVWIGRTRDINGIMSGEAVTPEWAGVTFMD